MTEPTPVPLRRRTFGEGTPRILYVHGISSHGETWWQVAAALAGEGRPGLAVDLRGHGESPRAGDYGVDAYAADLVALGGEWDLVVGHSLGGLVAAAAAGGLSTRALLLVDPVFDLSDEDSAAVRAELLADQASPPTAAALAAANPRWTERDVAVSRAGVELADAEALARTMDQNTPWHRAGLLAGLTVPTLVLGGDPTEGAMFDPSLIAGAANHHVAYEQVAGAGHIIQRDDPKAVIAAAARLLG